MKCSMANKALSEGVSGYKEMWGQERFYSVNRNEDHFAVVMMSHDDIVGYVP